VTAQRLLLRRYSGADLFEELRALRLLKQCAPALERRQRRSSG
jgi:hypothetical protein